MFDQARLQVRDFAAGAAMARHEHDAASLSILVQGGFVEWIGQSERTYRRGHVSYCPAGMAHAQDFGGAGARQVIVQPLADWIDYLADCKVALKDAPHACEAAFGVIGDRLVGETLRADAFSALACEGMLLEVVAAFGRRRHSPPPQGRPPPWLQTARDFLHENAQRPMPLAEVARAAGRHEIHLAREFRRHFGASVGAYSRWLRVERAATLLARRDLNVTEIAYECGFSSHAHLCREFKAHMGVTPTAYRAGEAGQPRARNPRP